MRRACLLPVLALCVAAPAAAEELTARQILERAVEAAGGESWLNPRTLVLEGEAIFYAPDSPTPRSRADDYRMWRAMNPDRTVSHGADGKVRITAKSGGRLLFEVGIGQADEVLRIMRSVGFGDLEITPDLNGIPRVVEGVLHKEL